MSRLPHKLSITVKAWSPEESLIPPVFREGGWATQVDDARVVTFSTDDQELYKKVSAAILDMESHYSYIDVSRYGGFTVNFTRKKRELDDVVGLVKETIANTVDFAGSTA